MILADLSTVVVGVTERTNWVFVVATDTEGLTGVGEATLDGCEELVELRVGQIRQVVLGHPFASPPDLVERLGIEDTPLGLINAAAVSAIEQAMWDIEGHRAGTPAGSLLGERRTDTLPLYANVNRALLDDRSPAAFAATAARAIEIGFHTVKCAPFDGVFRADLADASVRSLVDIGIDRVAAVRDTIGHDRDLIVDCHYRFTATSAPPVIDRLSAFNPHWVEAPVAEHRLDEWSAIREACDVRLAGGEMMTGIHRYRRFLDTTGVDIVMPDVKYVGGLSGVAAIAREAEQRGVLVAPHNPSGPVATIATANVAATLPNLHIVEYAFGECDWRPDLVGGAEQLAEGTLGVPDGPGLGFELDERVVAAHPRRPVRGLELRLYG